jgi:hypothetical protein
MLVVSTSARARARRLLVAGLVIIVAGLAAGVGIYAATLARVSSGLKSLAGQSAALSGCSTGLEVTRAGTYEVYYLYGAEVNINGTNDGCASAGVVRVDAPPTPPAVTVTLRRVAGAVMAVTPEPVPRHLSAGGVRAVAVAHVTLSPVGAYRLEVPEAATGVAFAIAVGPSLHRAQPWIAMLVASVALVVGLVVVALGFVAQTASSSSWPPAGSGSAGSGGAGPMVAVPTAPRGSAPLPAPWAVRPGSPLPPPPPPNSDHT